MSDKGDQVLFIQFAREPVVGAVKTRMQPHLSAEQACALHRELVLWSCAKLCAADLGAVELWVAGSVAHPVFEQCRSIGAIAVHHQLGVDLGQRMHHALSSTLRRYRKVILVGSDCPAIDGEYLKSAIRALNTHSIVLGPAVDGGYVLIGVTAVSASLFKGVAWGSAEVFAQTVERLRAENIMWAELEPLADIDRPEDLPQWWALREAANKAIV